MMPPTAAQIAGFQKRSPDGPMAQRIGSGPASTKLYRVEEKLAQALEAVARERMPFLPVDDPDLYRHGYPQALYDLFDALDTGAVRKAITAWLEDSPE